jgi:streptogramin lyase
VAEGSARGRCIARVDPRTGELTASIDCPDETDEIARSGARLLAAQGSLWVVDDTFEGWSLLRMDPRAGKLIEVLAMPGAGLCCSAGLFEHQGFLWLPHAARQFTVGHDFDATVEVLKIDPVRSRIVDRILLGGGSFSAGEGPLGSALLQDGSLWVTRPTPGVIDHVDLSSGEVLETVSLDEVPVPGPLAAYGGYLWVASINRSGGLLPIDTAEHRTAGGAVTTLERAPGLQRAEEIQVPEVGGPTMVGTPESLWILHSRRGSLLRVELAGG